MPAYLIAQCSIVDRPLYEQYIDKLIPVLYNFKAKILSVDESPLVMDGDINCNRVVIVEFDSKDTILDLYNSKEYQELLPIRKEAIPGTFVIVDGLENV